MENNRRNFLKGITALGVSSLLSVPAAHAETLNRSSSPKKKRALRVAHLTDIHILNKPNAEACLRRIFKEINGMKDKPDFIINTGDTIMDANKQTKEEVERRWNVWQTIVKTENKLPMYSCLGNHDVWWGPKELDQEYQKDPRYGKQWALEVLKMPDRYYTFQANGWHFIALDSINRTTGYQLDDQQFTWLEHTLATIPASAPVCVFNHVPMISACSWLYYAQREEAAALKYPTWDLHVDVKRIKDLFFKHKNVKLGLSGHIHYIDAVEYLGVKYLCNGAASGNWWDGVLDEFPPIYTLIDLYTDGSIDHQIINYDWKV